MKKTLLALLALAGFGLAWRAHSLSSPGLGDTGARRETVSDFDWDTLARTDLSDGSRSVVTAFVGIGDYSSGPRSRVFYLGSDAELKGKFLVYYPDARRPRQELRFYLDYRPIEVQVRALPAGSWSSASVLQQEGVAGGRNIFELVVPSIPRGRHDFAIVTRHSDAERPLPVVNGKDQEVPLVDQDIYVVQTVREADGTTSIRPSPPTAATHVDCADRERHLFAKGSAVAIVNCRKEATRGVLFGASVEPVFYELAGEMSGVFRFQQLERISHVSEPFEPNEGPDGSSRDTHRDLVGF